MATAQYTSILDSTSSQVSKAEIQSPEKNQGKALKRIFSLSMATPYIGLMIETGVWPAEQRINYSSLMLYHNIINSSKDGLVKQIILEQSTKPPKHLLWESEDNSRRIKYKIRKSSNNEEIRLEKNSQR